MPKPRTICWYRVMSRPINWGNYLYDTTKKIHIMFCSTESFYIYLYIKLNILLFMALDSLSLVCLAMSISICICLHIWNIFISWAEMYNWQQWSTFLSENHIFPLPLRNYIFHFPLRNKIPPLSRRMPIRAGNIPICLPVHIFVSIWTYFTFNATFFSGLSTSFIFLYIFLLFRFPFSYSTPSPPQKVSADISLPSGGGGLDNT
jgi:hypothetical protein